MKWLGMTLNKFKKKKPEDEPFVSVDPLTNPVFYDQWHGKKDRVLVTGCFDMFHFGHLYFLKRVYGEFVEGQDRELHIGLPDDTSYEYLKYRKPLHEFKHRKSILEALEIVEKVHGFQIWVDSPKGKGHPEDGHKYLIRQVKPVLFVDSRQKPEKDIGALPYLRDEGVPIEYVDSIDVHTTDLLQEAHRIYLRQTMEVRVEDHDPYAV